MMQNQELELYIHIPFCIRKCQYCDFLSGPATEETKDRYMEALCREIAGKSEIYRDYKITSLFIGGGTPSCVKPSWITRIMEIVREKYDLSREAEISMEINPGTVDELALKRYYQAGINRLSIGLQSAREEELKTLGRIHSFQQFLETYERAREIGFTNVNVDIMSGLPGQSSEYYEESLRKITSLEPAPEHISAYSLIVEEGTPFYEQYEAGTLELPEEETERAMYELTGTFLKKRGYERYEISNYAKAGKECRHNIGYWIRKNYVGFGIGAASLVENVRFKNTDNLTDYIEDFLNCREEIHSLSIQEQMEETMFLGLRLAKGVSVQNFEAVYGVRMEQVYAEVLEKHIKQGLLERYVSQTEPEEYIRLTPKGMDVSNYVMADFLEP